MYTQNLFFKFNKLVFVLISALFISPWTFAADPAYRFKEIRVGSGEWVVPKGCHPSERLAKLSSQIIAQYPLLLPPSEQAKVEIHFLLCNGAGFPEANSSIKRWGKVTEATMLVRSDSAQKGTLRLAVIAAHELAHIGNSAAGNENRAGPDGHGSSWLARTIRAGLPSVAFEVVGPGGAFRQYLADYRKASKEVCGMPSCGPENVEDSTLVDLSE